MHTEFITIAIDFDGTIIKGGQYPNAVKGEPNAIFCIKKLQSHPKVKTILWSCRDKNSDTAAYNRMIEWCKENDLHFDAINDNLDEYKSAGFACRKIFANIYIDDNSIADPTIMDKRVRNAKMLEFWNNFRKTIATDTNLNCWIENYLASII